MNLCLLATGGQRYVETRGLEIPFPPLSGPRANVLIAVPSTYPNGGLDAFYLAGHAFSSDNPDRSSLVVLSDPSKRDDFLQASEIVQMRLPAKLVVLSACETNVGPIQGEEGISALSTAFLLAGARTVVSTLWPIEDQASFTLMKAFYGHLGAGEFIAQSMASEKRGFLSKWGPEVSPLTGPDLSYKVQGQKNLCARSADLIE